MKVGIVGFPARRQDDRLQRAHRAAGGGGRLRRSRQAEPRRDQGAGRAHRPAERRSSRRARRRTRRWCSSTFPAAASAAPACSTRRRWCRCATPTRWCRWCAAFPIRSTQDAADPARDIESVQERAGARRPGDRREAPRAPAQGEGQGAGGGAARALPDGARGGDAAAPRRRSAPPRSAALSGFGLLSRLPLLVVVNVGEADVAAPLSAARADAARRRRRARPGAVRADRDGDRRRSTTPTAPPFSPTSACASRRATASCRPPMRCSI